MDGDPFGDAGAGGGLTAGQLERGGAEVVMLAPGGKQVIGGMSGAPVAAQHLKQARGEHGVAVLGTFALLDAKQAAFGIDVGNAQRKSFADAQSSAVADHEGGAIFETGDMVEETQHFFLAEYDGEFVGTANVGEVLVGPGHFERGEVEELQGGNALVDGLGGKLAFVEEVELILADGLDIEKLGADAEVLGETGDETDIVFLGAGCQVAQLHIFDHALT